LIGFDRRCRFQRRPFLQQRRRHRLIKRVGLILPLDERLTP